MDAITIEVYEHTLEIIDYEGVLDLLGGQLTFIGYSPSRGEVASVLDNAMKQGSRSVLWVAYSQEQAVGFAFGNVCCGLESGGDYLWLNELYVSEKARLQGLGSLLLETVRSWAKLRGCTYLALVTHPSNVRAQHLYQEAGMELENLVWVDAYL
ncbi:MAG: GNAT family N-acetyltransferase [Sphaerochaeta sp.]|uniref:GNAT family N-acetyltransferase n=1 Tax=Sphaerochaeta sp. TaxID=1972642 RepID=UPI0029741C47|nr:GNAT family N-acetyltransferase [Sphaerochaeta sp.]MDD3929402.1 GNAT family N-acetyltransferase [Sphaerochaeta sp.]